MSIYGNQRDTLPDWQRELLSRRKMSQNQFSRRHTDVLETHRVASMDGGKAVRSPNKTADMIKFFNQAGDVDTVGFPRTGSPRHLPVAPSVSAAQPTTMRSGILEPDVPPPSQSVHHATHLHTAASGSPQLHFVQPSEQSSVYRKSVHVVQQVPDESLYSDIVIIEDEWEEEVGSSVRNRYSNQDYLAGAVQHMGEDKRLFLSNGRSDVDTRGFGGVGSRILRNKRNVGRDSLNSGGDSDGMMGSGGESDSSEEIHYGPGFVSRLKSRYMSVALRGSARGSLGTLRRTASLEDFLDLDRVKDEECAVDSAVHGRNSAAHRANQARLNAVTSAKAQSRRESMKRAQSVEVLSILSESPRKPRDSVLSDAFFKTENRPPSESPPPLPPREKLELSNVNFVLSNAPALVNDSVVIAEKPGSAHGAFVQPVPASSTQTKSASSYSRSKYAPSSGSKPLQKPSVGVLFGVKDKELPAPDTVKETRKLFENETNRAVGRKPKSGTGLTKSKSTSSLYTKPASRSSSTEKSALSRKKSDEDLPKNHLGSSAQRTGTGTASRRSLNKTVGSTSKSPVMESQRRTNSPMSGSSRERFQAKPIVNSSPQVTRPAIPAKPSHLSPIVAKNNTYRSTPREKPLPSKSAVGKQSAYTRSERGISSSSRDSSKPTELEEGVKRVSLDSIQNIRKDSSVLNFKFPSGSSGSKSHLPGSVTTSREPISNRQNGVKTRGTARSSFNNAGSQGANSCASPSNVSSKINGLDSPESKPQLSKQIGVIKPLSRENEPEAPEIKPRAVIISADQTNNNKAAEKAPVTVKPWTPSSQRLSGKVLGDIPGQEKETSKPNVNLFKTTDPSQTNSVISTPACEKSPPVIPPRNGSKLEHSTSVLRPKEKYFDSNIEAVPSPPEVRRDLRSSSTDPRVNGDTTDRAGGYRESWKARQVQQNTVVFNFINSNKDVSHIENDGLDMTKRTANKKGVVFLGTNGETCDGTSEEETEVELLTNFVFIGANITTGKSSIRSKSTSKKLTITWKDETEVFEYPSFESSKEDQSDQGTSSTSLKMNTSVGSAGGLGSYTPSKIQMSDSPFQLGVSRSKPSATPAVEAPPSPPSDPYLLPADQGISWGSSASSDMLF